MDKIKKMNKNVNPLMQRPIISTSFSKPDTFIKSSLTSSNCVKSVERLGHSLHNGIAMMNDLRPIEDKRHGNHISMVEPTRTEASSKGRSAYLATA